jgi:hypothetical protein
MKKQGGSGVTIMKIAMIGIGYVGMVSGVCFSDFSHDIMSSIRMLARSGAARWLNADLRTRPRFAGRSIANKLLVDLRNIYRRDEVLCHSFRHIAIGTLAE